MRTQGRADEGAIAILVAVLAVALFGFGAIVVDLGFARGLKQQAVDSADASSLAGAADLDSCTRRRCTSATAAVKASARENFGTQDADWATCSATPPNDLNLRDVAWRARRSGTSCIQYGFASGQSRPTLVFVAVPPRDSASFFGGVFGYAGTTISATAVAGLISTTAAPCALCVLGQDGIDVTDGAAVTLPTAGSLYARRAKASSGGSISVPAGQIYLTEAPSDQTAMTPQPVSVTGQPVIDPFEGDAPPAVTNQDHDNDTCDAEVLEPGTYDEQLDVTGDCELTNGVYVFKEDVTVETGGNLHGNAVSLVFDGSSDLTVKVNGTVSVTQPDPDSQFALFYEGDGRVIVDGGDLRLGDGDVYGRDGELEVLSSGSAEIRGSTVVKQLKVNTGQFLVSPLEPAPGPQVGRPDLGLVR